MKDFFRTLNSFLDSQEKRKEINVSYIKKLSNAVLQTKKQIEINKNQERDRSAEYDIAMLWNNLANDFVAYNHPDAFELSRMCLAKSEYWLDEDIWSHDESSSLSITFRQIEKQINRMKKNINPAFVEDD